MVLFAERYKRVNYTVRKKSRSYTEINTNVPVTKYNSKSNGKFKGTAIEC